MIQLDFPSQSSIKKILGMWLVDISHRTNSSHVSFSGHINMQHPYLKWSNQFEPSDNASAALSDGSNW